MSAAPFQWMTLAGCVIIIPVVTVLWRVRAITTLVAAIIGTIGGVYLVFYVWLLFLAMPAEYAWLSAFIRTVEIYALLGVVVAHLVAYWKSK
jgi:hypothetical protein